MSKSTKLVKFGKVNGKSSDDLNHCHKCNTLFKYEEMVLTKRAGTSGRKRYCLKCARQVNLI